MPSIGKFAAFTERAKDVIVSELRNHFSLLGSQNVITEQPIIEKYGLAGQSPQESFVQITTALPHENQRIPNIAVMSSPGNERKINIGRQVIDTFHHPKTGFPTIRESVCADMTIIIEIAANDTNMRSEIVDIVSGFFTVYLEDKNFTFYGDGETSLHQIILKSQAAITGETDQPRPQGEGFERIYFNRITVPIIFLDYVDRPSFDVNMCLNQNLTEDDNPDLILRDVPFPFPKLAPFVFANHDDFEINGTLAGPNRLWDVFENPFSHVARNRESAIRGLYGVFLESLEAGKELAVIQNKDGGLLSGKVRTRFNLGNGHSAFLLYSMLQGSNPLVDPAYFLLIKNGSPGRLALFKGTLAAVSGPPLVEGSFLVIPEAINLAAQLEWKVDVGRHRTRLRGYITHCESDAFGALGKRIDFIDNTAAYLTSEGEGVGFRPNPDGSPVSGLIRIDDLEILKELTNS